MSICARDVPPDEICERAQLSSAAARRSAVLEAEPVAARFPRAPLGDRAALSLSHPEPPGAAGARARPRLACRAAARCRSDARGGAAPDRASRFLDLPRLAVPGEIAGQDARPAGRDAASASEIHIAAGARSFLHHQVRNMVGTLKLVGLGRWPRTAWPARWRRATAAPAGRPRPPKGWRWSRCAMMMYWRTTELPEPSQC